jgi:hypothetical protein
MKNHTGRARVSKNVLTFDRLPIRLNGVSADTPFSTSMPVALASLKVLLCSGAAKLVSYQIF